ncbi:hypothetical protein [Cupriavidus pauculus]|uniref:hypothetical protein n=1 Tax=Cupriavidus pauculus TaxID=82633 RepID=UPI001EE20876|nr:hypothetical protein [Cupriavidus pauculus]GJG98522.1 hypothetical protein CBA19C6_28555 [Cupriavidus pauculus]
MTSKKAAARKNSPTELTLRSYNVGFGDCFLLTFHYPADLRHVLIDFGTTRAPKGNDSAKYLLEIARSIETDCGGKLHAVVATHRHKDHISGFSLVSGKGPGQIIRKLNPDLVIQPWTEDPEAQADAKAPTSVSQSNHHQAMRKHLVMLNDMNEFAGYVKSASARLRGNHLNEVKAQLEFLGDDNELANRDAVENLASMGRRRKYVYAGASAGLEDILPGVKTYVLGPPTLEQHAGIRKQSQTNAEEYWQLSGARAEFWAKRGRIARMGKPGSFSLFPKYEDVRRPWDMRWYRYQAQREQAENLLSLVRILDKQMNNTSVILLFEANGKFILFPGDAQFENWQYALSDPKHVARLANVGLYKVGHHGSRNATPKTLWEGFASKGGKSKKGRLVTLLSTLDHVHGSEERHTEVPRQTLLDALRKESDLHDTRTVREGEFCSVTRFLL